MKPSYSGERYLLEKLRNSKTFYPNDPLLLEKLQTCGFNVRELVQSPGYCHFDLPKEWHLLDSNIYQVWDVVDPEGMIQFQLAYLPYVDRSIFRIVNVPLRHVEETERHPSEFRIKSEMREDSRWIIQTAFFVAKIKPPENEKVTCESEMPILKYEPPSPHQKEKPHYSHYSERRPKYVNIKVMLSHVNCMA